MIGDRFKKLRANFRMTQTLPKNHVEVPISKHAAHVYTPSIYKMFETEYLDGLSWQIKEMNVFRTVRRYCVYNEKG